MLVRKGISKGKEGKVRSISTLARSGNNISLIYLKHFLIYLRVPNFLNQFLVSRYNTIIKKKAFPKFGAYFVLISGFFAVQLTVEKRHYRKDDNISQLG